MDRSQITVGEISIVGNLRETDTLYESPQGYQSNLKGGYKGKGFVLKEMPPSLLLKHLAPEQTCHSCWRHSWLKAVPTLQTQACMGAAALRWLSLRLCGAPGLDVNGSFV